MNVNYLHVLTVSLLQSIERPGIQSYCQVPSASHSDLSLSLRPEQEPGQERGQRGVPPSGVVTGTNTNMVLFDGNDYSTVFQR